MQKGESNIMKKTARLFILAMILLTLITPMQTSAKSSKTVYYSTVFRGKNYKTETHPKLRKIVFKKNKVITYGSFTSQKKLDWRAPSKYCRAKKRVFKTTKKTKYYLIDEDEYYRCSLKEFKKYLLNMALYIKVRNGKAVALMISP